MLQCVTRQTSDGSSDAELFAGSARARARRRVPRQGASRQPVLFLLFSCKPKPTLLMSTAAAAEYLPERDRL